jgi:hypothetical protein
LNPNLSRPDSRGLFLISALFLFLELCFIRWFPAHVLFLSFFTNTVLLASFLGLSVGCLTAKSSRDYLRWTPLLLVLSLTAGGVTEWVRLRMQDVVDVGGNEASPQMVYFGAEYKSPDIAQFAIPVEVMAAGFFLLIALSLVGPGQLLGRKLATLDNPVRGYLINIGGSLAGILLFNVFSWTMPPVFWFSAVAIGLGWFLWQQHQRSWLALGLLATVPLIVLAPQLLQLGVINEKFPETHWSPYYRVNYSPKANEIVVNLMGHQIMVPRKDPFPAYALPYALQRDSGGPKFKDILIIGAGSGNDVSRAVEWAAADAHIDAVEIDPVIQKLGIRDHPDRPYQDPRVHRHLNDGRNFLRTTQRKYDLVVFALIDSLVLHSSLSNIRLESYLFTKESFADVQRCLKPEGTFAMYNYFRQGWIVSRLDWSLYNVFQQWPLVLTMPNVDAITTGEKSPGFTLFFAGKGAERFERAFREKGSYQVANGQRPTPDGPTGFRAIENSLRFAPTKVETPPWIDAATDDWPFLYLKNPTIPDLTWRGILLMGGLSLVMLWWFSRGRDKAKEASGITGRMVLLGVGFMLLETKAVVHMALLFGSTWFVNTIVFTAILIVILLANLWVLRHKPQQLLPYYIALLISLAANALVPLDSLLGMSPLLQAVLAGGLVFSPVLFASVIFATSFGQALSPNRALAWNTAGAIGGGLLEASSMLVGFRYLVVIAAVVYGASWLFRLPKKAIAK